jgi:hypothetical protein
MKSLKMLAEDKKQQVYDTLRAMTEHIIVLVLEVTQADESSQSQSQREGMYYVGIC